MIQLYRMHDVPEHNRGCFPVASHEEAQRWNREGFGIFWAVNEFDGGRRIENLTHLRAWAVDLDEGTKAEQRARLLSSPLVPSLVVETKSGHHAYWSAKDAKPEHWNAIVLERLVPYYGADKNARDIARILRVPGYLHQKDPANPFPIRIVWRHQVAYTEQQIAERYPWLPAKTAEPKIEPGQVPTARVEFRDGDDFWDRVYCLDCEDGLRRLSGHGACRGEQFTFRENTSGTKNIFVDGKGTSCWIDRAKRIGSLSHGGPTLYQWLTHPDYGNTPSEAVRVLKSIYPELEANP